LDKVSLDNIQQAGGNCDLSLEEPKQWVLNRLGRPIQELKLCGQRFKHLFASSLGLDKPGCLAFFLPVITSKLITCSLQQLDLRKQILSLAFSHDLFNVVWKTTPGWTFI